MVECSKQPTSLMASVLREGWPSKTMTRSARYVAMMKSCSTTKAVFFAWRMNLKEGESEGGRHGWREGGREGGREVGEGGREVGEGGRERPAAAVLSPLDDFCRDKTLLRVQVCRRLVYEVDVRGLQAVPVRERK